MAQPLTYNNIRACIKKEFKLSEEEFDENFISIGALFASQELDFYYEILEGSVYPNMLADFWMFASLRIDPEGRTTIVSEDRMAHVTITPSTISDLLICNNSGESFDDNTINMTTYHMLRTLMEHVPFSAKFIRIWHQLLMGNFRPRSHDLDRIMMEDLEFILCALRGKKINFPLLIFKGLVEVVSMAASRQGVVTCLPYGRFLSYMFLKKGIVRRMRRTGSLDMFEAESLPLLSLEGLEQRIN